MLTKDRAELIDKLFQASDRAFDNGDNRLGSQKLWEAAECAMSAVAESRDMASATEDDHFDLLELLISEAGKSHDYYDGYDLISGYLVAGYIRDNADYDFMESCELVGTRSLIRLFIDELLPFAE